MGVLMTLRYFTNFQKPVSIIFLFSILFIFSCGSDNSITNSSDNITINKPLDIHDENSVTSKYPRYKWLVWEIPPEVTGCILLMDLFAPYLLELHGISEIKSDNNTNSKLQKEWTEKSYDFRDNYLSSSIKGKEYIYCYYKLSEYSIKNNLYGEYYKEHLKIIPMCINIASNIQYGNENNYIPIGNSNYNSLQKILDIYRNSENNKNIKPVIDYLEADLEKYYNKPKAEIAADFGF